MRLTDVEIRQHATRKRPATRAAPSRPPKRPQIASPIDLAAMGTQSDAEHASGYEPVIVLSAPMVPTEAPAEEGLAKGVAEGASAPPPTKEVQTEAREPEGPAVAAAAGSGGTQSSSSFPSLSDFRAWAAGRGKAPMESGDDTRSAGRATSSDVQLPEGASALANHNLARRLCQATILPIDREIMKSQMVSDMLSSFFPTVIQVSSSSSLFIFIIVFYQLDLLTIGLLYAADLQHVRAGGRVSEVRRHSCGLKEEGRDRRDREGDHGRAVEAVGRS